MRYERVQVFAAHADDEIIGPGGTLARLAREGAQVQVVTLTDGETATGRGERPEDVAAARREEAAAADRILGISSRVFLHLPTQGVVNDRPTFQRIVGLIRAFRPQVIFTHAWEDKHRDHRACAELVREARWKASEPHVLGDLGDPWYTEELYHFEIFELLPHPHVVVDISDTFAAKRAAMEAQVSQLNVLPGIVAYMEGVAMARGFLRGTRYAEAFAADNLLPRRA